MSRLNRQPRGFLAFYPRIRGTRARQSPIPKRQETNWPPDTEDGVQPEDKRTVADVWDQYLRLVLKPLLVAEKQKDDDHRSANEMVIEVLREKTGLAQDLYEPIHCFNPLPFMAGTRSL